MLRIATLGGAWIIAGATTLAGQEPGDTVVRLATTPRYPGIATLGPEISIGESSGAPEYTFTRIQSIVMVPDGSVIIADVPISAGGRGNTASATIRWYGADGRYIRSLGRGGEGPGEYIQPSGIGRLPDGTILVRDARLHRINVYSPAGEAAATWRIDEPTNATYGGADRLVADNAGFIYLRASERPRREPGAPLIIPQPTDDRLVRLRSDGTVIDTLAAPRLPDVTPPILRVTVRSSTLGSAVPYSPWKTWSRSPLGYFVTAVTNRYAIDLRIPPATPGAARPPTWRAGDRVVSVRRQVAPIPISDDERAARRAVVERRMQARDPRWEWSGPDVPRVKPPIKGVLVADDGRLWVHVSVPSERFSPPADASPTDEASLPFREPPLYEVFEPDGTWLGRVRLPEGVRLHAMRGDIVWGVTTDADDVPTARRFRIAWR